MKRILLLLAVVLVIFACRKDSELTSNTTETTNSPGITVEADLMGVVTDENNNPIANAVVQYGTNAGAVTNEDGIFYVRNQKFNQRGAYVKVNMPGYFEGSRRFYPKAGNESQVRIQLIERTMTASFQAEEGATIETNGNAQIAFSPNSIQDASGNLYNGEVQVFAKWLDPSAPETGRQMPGSLEGITESSENRSLVTYGMMVVELAAPSNLPLNIAEGSTAELTFPVPAELQGNAPAEIPLWYFDKTDGLWKEEGKATLIGGNYVGNVSHFSFWNCDAPFPLVNISGTITVEGAPFAHAPIRISFASNGNTGYGYTDDQGYFGGKVPKDEALVLEILDECGNVIYSQDIGPFSADTDLGIINLPNAGAIPNLVMVTGSVENCDGNPVSNGYVTAKWGTYNHHSVSLDSVGGFSFTTIICDATDFEITGYDIDNLIKSNPQTHNVATSVDVGTIIACDVVLDEHFTFIINGEERVYLDPSAGKDANITFINISAPDSTTLTWSLVGSDIAVNYADSTEYFSYQSPLATNNANYVYCASSPNNPAGFADCGFTSVEFSQYGNVGEKIIGTFSADMDFSGVDGNIQTLPVTGSFEITRDY